MCIPHSNCVQYVTDLSAFESILPANTNSSVASKSGRQTVLLKKAHQIVNYITVTVFSYETHFPSFLALSYGRWCRRTQRCFSNDTASQLRWHQKSWIKGEMQRFQWDGPNLSFQSRGYVTLICSAFYHLDICTALHYFFNTLHFHYITLHFHYITFT